MPTLVAPESDGVSIPRDNGRVVFSPRERFNKQRILSGYIREWNPKIYLWWHNTTYGGRCCLMIYGSRIPVKIHRDFRINAQIITSEVTKKWIIIFNFFIFFFANSTHQSDLQQRIAQITTVTSSSTTRALQQNKLRSIRQNRIAQ